MHCFVTGATGFIGSYLVRFLLNKGHEVSILVRPSSDLWRIRDIISRVKVIHGDLASVENISADISHLKAEVIFNLAWQGGNSYKYQNDSSQLFQNLYGSLHLVELAKEMGTRKWIGFGSSIEYGNYEIPISEELRPVPNTLYGINKYCVSLLTEKFCQLYGIDFAWIRPFWVYGPCDDPLRMIPMVATSLLRREKPALTPGEQLWDYLYIDDAIEAIYQIGIQSEAQGIFNLGSGKPSTIRSVVEGIRDLIDPDLPLGFGDIPYRPDQVMHLKADISRLQKITGWSPQIDLEEGLRRTVEWHKSLAANPA